MHKCMNCKMLGSNPTGPIVPKYPFCKYYHDFLGSEPETGDTVRAEDCLLEGEVPRFEEVNGKWLRVND